MKIDDKHKIWLSAVLIVLFLLVTVFGALAVEWVVTGSGENTWRSVAVSANGSVVYAGATNSTLFRSFDYGVNFEELPNGGVGFWYDVCTSDDGSIIVGGMNERYIQVSHDFGETWFNASAPGVGGWGDVDCSGSGENLVAVDVSAAKNIWVSNDFGVTWSARGLSTNYISVTMDNSGQYIVAGRIFNRAYYSTDFGVTFNLGIDDPSFRVGTLFSSGDGQRVIGMGNYIWMSLNYGASWFVVNDTYDANGWGYLLTGSDDFSVLVASDYISNGRLWESYDFGYTWVENLDSGVPAYNTIWFGGDSSNDGVYLYAVQFYTLPGYVWTNVRCEELWVSEFSACVGGNQTLFYLDANVCGTYNDLPVDNGTIQACSSGGGGVHWPDEEEPNVIEVVVPVIPVVEPGFFAEFSLLFEKLFSGELSLEEARLLLSGYWWFLLIIVGVLVALIYLATNQKNKSRKVKK